MANPIDRRIELFRIDFVVFGHMGFPWTGCRIAWDCFLEVILHRYRLSVCIHLIKLGPAVREREDRGRSLELSPAEPV
jgi:hypothetical protein